MTLSTAQFGHFNLYTIETGRFRLDGGAMFGVVPKTLWSRRMEVDDKNRIPMAMRCLLVESTETGHIYLIDDGIGSKFDEKMSAIYDLDFDHSDLLSSLNEQGFSPDDITDIIFTHLHFDHCGGTTYYDENGELAHTFKNAAYHITKKHWQTATKPNKREQASFLADNIKPLEQSDRVNLVDEHHQYEDNLTALPVEGHSLGQQLPKLTDGERHLVFAADLLPSHVHLPLPWVMGYDMYPAQTLKEKQAYLDEAVDDQWYLFLEHDAQEEIIQIDKQDGRYRVKTKLTLDQL